MAAPGRERFLESLRSERSVTDNEEPDLPGSAAREDCLSVKSQALSETGQSAERSIWEVSCLNAKNFEQDAPRCVSPSIATEAPRRANDLRDSDDAESTCRRRDSEEPSHVRPRTDSELPSVRKLDTETDDTRHAKDRNDNDEPKHVASETLRVAPRSDAPKTDRDNPNLAKLRTEREAPNRAQMKANKEKRRARACHTSGNHG